MKLLTRITTSLLLATAVLGSSAFAQEAPAGQQTAPPATQPATQPTTQPAVQKDQAAQRRDMIDQIRAEMGLPLQHDTGIASPDWFVPQSASTTAPSTDGVLSYINWITGIFSAIILGAMVLFAIRYRRRSDDEADPEGVSTHSTTLELTWTIIPTCIVLVMFTLGFKDFLSQTVAPSGAYEVRVLGQMWSWNFTYPNGASSPDLHIPRDRPVKFVVSSQDVIHSLFIPAFRVKKDVVPGRFNQFWAQPTKDGIFEIFCTEYCGTNHSRMIAKAFVYPPERYNDWFAKITNIYEDPFGGGEYPPEQVGQTLWAQRGCIGCHSTDGSIKQAPTWKNLYGAERTFVDGSTAVADDNYILQSILQPQARLVLGYGASMPSYAGQLDERDIRSIIAYMKSLSDGAAPVGPTGETVAPNQSQSLGSENEQERGPG